MIKNFISFLLFVVTPPPSQSVHESSIASETSSIMSIQPLKLSGSTSGSISGGGGQTILQELDSLMATLTYFKVLLAPTKSPVICSKPPLEAKSEEKRRTLTVCWGNWRRMSVRQGWIQSPREHVPLAINQSWGR